MNGWDSAIGSLRGICEFLDPEDDDPNISRRRPAEWWLNLIKASRHVIKIGQQAVDSIEKRSNWIHKQALKVTPALFTI